MTPGPDTISFTTTIETGVFVRNEIGLAILDVCAQESASEHLHLSSTSSGR